MIGRSNEEEFKFVMNKMIWHAPNIRETGIDLTEIYRHKILCNILIKHRESFAENLEKLMVGDYFEEDGQHLKQKMIDDMVIWGDYFIIYRCYSFLCNRIKIQEGPRLNLSSIISSISLKVFGDKTLLYYTVTRKCWRGWKKCSNQ